MALRLGLYQTVLNKTNVCFTRRQEMVKLVSEIKRCDQSAETLNKKTFEFLNNKRYWNYHKEFIKEVVGYLPEPVLRWLSTQDYTLTDDFYTGLYLALMNELDVDKAQEKWIELYRYIKNKDSSDVTCLENNLNTTNSASTLRVLNKLFSKYDLSVLKLNSQPDTFIINSLDGHLVSDSQPTKQGIEKVTVLVTAYNAEKTIVSCINSLINQTWSNIEIIVINDASNDKTWDRLLDLNKQFKQVSIINLPVNVGTFAAKGIGALYASGDFLTCQDSDDWAHPMKIEEQVKPLINDSSLIATTSHWLRVDTSGNFHVRQFYPFLRQNPASPMFRLERIKKEIGLWHIVRTGADSEFFERLKLYYGKEKIFVIEKPLTIASHRPDSLMTSSEYGAYSNSSRVKRLDYWEAWRLWHINCLYHKRNPFMPTMVEQSSLWNPLFKGIPKKLLVSNKDLEINLQQHIFLR